MKFCPECEAKTVEALQAASKPTGSGLNAHGYVESGEAAYDAEHYDEAIAKYTEAIRLNSEYADAYFWRGLIYQENYQMKLAIRDFQNAVRLDPEDTGYQKSLEEVRCLR